MEFMRVLHDLRSLWRLCTAIDNSRAVLASVSRIAVGVGVVDDTCGCVFLSAVIVDDDATVEESTVIVSALLSVFISVSKALHCIDISVLTKINMSRKYIVRIVRVDLFILWLLLRRPMMNDRRLAQDVFITSFEAQVTPIN